MTKSERFIQNLLKAFRCNGEGDKVVDLEKIAAQEQKQFSFETLVSATKNFHDSNKLGEGGFGVVYKGKLTDGREIAVKKLSQSSRQGRREFMNEARLLARVQHRNVVNLLGYCVYGAEKLLVYEYVANESLDKLIFKSSKQDELDWRRRFDIILGITRGLLYLHEDAHSVIIHRDIKASNILLDDKWVPKIADFGMARLFPEDQTHVNTRVAGTNGYMAPEYVLNGHLSVKADVFSFGVVVLELISGQKNSTFNQKSDGLTLVEWAYDLHKNGRGMEFADPKLASSAVPEQVAMCVQIGLLCVQTDPKERPDMRRVAVMLSKKPGSVLEEPTKPGYPSFTNRRRYHRQRTGGSSSSPGQANRSSSSSSGGGGTSSDSRTQTFTSTNSVAAPATPTYLRSPLSDLHGKRPMES